MSNQTNVFRPSHVASEASRIIWGCAVRSMDTDRESISPAETAFIYSIYHYAVLDILNSWYIEKDVRSLFIPTVAHIMQADPFDPSHAPILATMHKAVCSTIECMSEERYDASTEKGATEILSLKNLAMQPSISFPYAPSDFEIQYYVKSVKSLRVELTEVIREEFKKGVNTPAGNNQSKTNPSKSKSLHVVLAIIAVAAFLWVCGLVKMDLNTYNAVAPAQQASTEPKVELKPRPTPSHGAILKNPSATKNAPLEIKTSGSGYYCFILERTGHSERYMVFFAHAGKTVKVNVPTGKYTLYYAYGNTWYGTDNLFGKDTVRKKCDTTLSFYKDSDGYSGYTLTLYPVSNGNMDTSIVKEADFPQ